MNGKYVYVLPNDIMYKRVGDQSASEMLMNNGFISLQFSGNIAVIKTRPGYASSMAYDIDKEYRLSTAERLLVSSNFTIEELMDRTGFTNRSTFYKAFSQRYGMPPRQYCEQQKYE